MKSAFGCTGRMKTVWGQKQIGYLADERLKKKDLTRRLQSENRKREKIKNHVKQRLSESLTDLLSDLLAKK